MKSIFFSLLLFSSVQGFSQVAIASNDPLQLYKQANLSLDVGDVRSADLIFKQVIEFYELEGRTKEVPENYLGMALAFAFNGHYKASIRYHKKALKAHHKYRQDESDDAIRFNLGLAYQLAGRERKAKRYLM